MLRGDSLLICPVYNEAPHLEEFFTSLRRCYFGAVLFIDDGSSDKSPSILQGYRSRRTSLISHRQRSGYGQALLSGFQFALEHSYQRIVTIDTDLQHNPEHIYMFLRELIEAEVVLGSRYIRIDQYSQAPRERLLINRYISRLFQVLFSVNISDPFCGFRAYRDSFLKRARIKETGYNQGLEILLEVIRLQAGFKELPIEAIYLSPQRQFGGGLDEPQTRLLYYLEIIGRKKQEIDHAHSASLKCQS